MRKPIIANHENTSSIDKTGMIFATCPKCRTPLFVPQRSKLWLFIANRWLDLSMIFIPKKYKLSKDNRPEHDQIANMYHCPVCGDYVWSGKPYLPGAEHSYTINFKRRKRL